MSESSCSLCADPSPVLYETTHWTVALNTNQATLGRVYFVLRRHDTDVANLTPDEVTELWRCLGSVKAVIHELFAPDHYNFMFLMNLDPHVHMHLYPRYQTERTFAGELFDDPLYGGHYDPSHNRKLDEATFEKLASVIKSAIRGRVGKEVAQ